MSVEVHAVAAPVALDVAEAAAAAAFELPVHAIQPLPTAPAVAPAEHRERAPGASSEDDGFEFGSDAASDSSSSWESSDEETGAPITSASLPAWLARRTAGGRCATGGGWPSRPSLILFRCAATSTRRMTRRLHACRHPLSQRCAAAPLHHIPKCQSRSLNLFPGSRACAAAG